MVPTFAVWGVVGRVHVVVFALNIVRAAVRRAEFWFASIKVFAIIAFIVIGLLAIFGAGRLPVAVRAVAGQLRGQRLVQRHRADFLDALLTVVFAFSGTEVVGVAAGEARIPRVVRSQGRAHHGAALAVFFIGSILVMAALIPGIRPAWMHCVRAGVPVNRYAVRRRHHELRRGVDGRAFRRELGLYVCSRMVWSLAEGG